MIKPKASCLRLRWREKIASLIISWFISMVERTLSYLSGLLSIDYSNDPVASLVEAFSYTHLKAQLWKRRMSFVLRHSPTTNLLTRPSRLQDRLKIWFRMLILIAWWKPLPQARRDFVPILDRHLRDSGASSRARFSIILYVAFQFLGNGTSIYVLSQ